jgi:hypothetical protein
VPHRSQTLNTPTAPLFPAATRNRDSSSTGKPPSNRECELLESRLTHRKQTVASRSNRELSTNPSFCDSRFSGVCPRHSLALTQEGPPATRLPRRRRGHCHTFLTGSASQTEFGLTSRKQSPKKFLTGARTHIKNSAFQRPPPLDLENAAASALSVPALVVMQKGRRFWRRPFVHNVNRG